MADLNVTTTTIDGVAVLTVEYSPELLLRRDAFKRLGEEFVDKYRQVVANGTATTHSCVVEIKAHTAGSPLVRALYDLYREVTGEGGQVFCVGYPPDYISSLTTLGLPALAGFNLANNRQEAIQKLTSSQFR